MFKNISRRSALTAAVGSIASASIVNVQAAGHPPALSHDCDLELIKLRRAINAYQAAVRVECRTHSANRSAFAAAEAESNAREAVVSAMADSIYARAPASARDVALRAELLRQYFFNGHEECLEEAEAGTPDFALAKLYEAAVIVGGGHE